MCTLRIKKNIYFKKRLDKHKINNPNLNFLLERRFSWMKKYIYNKRKNN